MVRTDTLQPPKALPQLEWLCRCHSNNTVSYPLVCCVLSLLCDVYGSGVQLIEVFRGGTPLLAVAQYSPAAISGLFATLLMAWLSHRIAAHWILAMALCAFCVANLLLALCTIDSTYWTYLFFAIIIAPFGMVRPCPTPGHPYYTTLPY